MKINNQKNGNLDFDAINARYRMARDTGISSYNWYAAYNTLKVSINDIPALLAALKAKRARAEALERAIKGMQIQNRCPLCVNNWKRGNNDYLIVCDHKKDPDNHNCNWQFDQARFTPEV